MPANLWDVTDRDIDRLTKGLLERWLGADGAGHEQVPTPGPITDMSASVSAAREACRLRYLNGAAVVTYGLPTMLGR